MQDDDHTDTEAGRRRILDETARVWLLNAVLVAVGLGLWIWLRGLPLPDTAVHIPWWALAAGFAVTEMCAVHIHFRRSAHSLTLGEIPLVLGLLFCAPADIMLAWVVGAGLMLLPQRGIPRIRVVFNVAQFGTTAGVAIGVFHLLAPAQDALGPVVWLVAGLAALVSDAVASVLVGSAMALSGERVTAAKLGRTVASGSVVAATNASVALAAGVVLAADPVAGALLLVPAAAIFLAYRAYISERNKHTRLEFLYDAGRALTRAPSAESGLAGLLAMSLETFRAELADGCMFAGEGDEPGVDVTVGPGDRVVVGQASGLGEVLAGLVDGRPGAQVVRTADLRGEAAERFAARGIEHAMVAALPGDRRTVGAVMVANRMGVGGTFGPDELRLFETLARHTGATLEQDRLGRTVTELRDIQRHLEHQAFHDPLTALPNRLLFTNRVRHALTRRGGNVALLYLDLDDFKTINDTLGHDAGDELLREAARRLGASLRTADTPARLGGDEFAVLLVDIAEEHARIVAGRILDNLREPFALAGQSVPVHASLGVALADSGEVSVEELMRNADTAMYVSKHGGKRGYSVYERGMEAPAPPSGARGRVEAVR
jgi:diguanylate cyclase (GGDEF)-like protein